MRYSYILLHILLLISFKYNYAQLPIDGINYKDSIVGGSWLATAGMTIVHPNGTDDAVTGIVLPTFPGFYYGGNFYGTGATVWISSNGWISLANPGGSRPVNDLSGSTVPTIAPLWDDLKVKVNVGADSAAVRYRVLNSGASGYLHVEWDSMLWDRSGTTQAISFQMRIYVYSHSTKPNHIEFYYRHSGGSTGNLAGAPSASIGITGFCAGDFYSAQSQGGTFLKSNDVNNISGKPSQSTYFSLRPISHPNNTCASAYPFAFGAGNAITSYDATTLHSTPSSAAAACSQWANKASDVWFTFTKPANITRFEVFTTNLDCRGANYRPAIEVYTNCAGAAIACDFGSAGPAGTNATSYINLTSQPCAATTYWVRVANDSLYKSYFTFNVRPPGRDCAFANDITGCGIPYSSPAGLSTCNFINNYDSLNSSCNNSFQKGEEYVFSYTPPVTQCVNFSLQNTPLNSFPGLFIYRGCPTSGSCMGVVTGLGGSNLNFNNVTLAAGQTYYFVVDYDSSNGIPCLNNFNLNITLSALSAPGEDLCTSAPTFIVNSSAFSTCTGGTNYNNSCATPSAAGIPLPTCGRFTDGVTPDVWFRFQSINTNPHQINVNPGLSPLAQDLAMAIYTGGCAGPWTLIDCDDNSNAAGFNYPALSIVPSAAGVWYYVRVWSNDGTQPGNFNICGITGCNPSNDLPCNAINLTLGVPVTGDNACSSGSGEPGNASCWGAGNTLNTVWYKFTPTFTGSVIIRTRLFTLFDSQIAVYNGPCGVGMTEIAGACNNDISEGCSGATRTYRHSVLTLAVTNGVTYFVRVDGRGSNTGSFEIYVNDVTQPLPPVPLQDCVLAQTICSNAGFTVADPGYQGIGHYCDLPSSGTCFIGERSSAFYLFSISGPGLVQFSINPFNNTDYDFFIWRVDGVANYCTQLNVPSAFPWYSASWTDTYGPTGMSNAIAGTSSSSRCIGAVGPAFHPAYPVSGGEIFLLMVSNWFGNTSGFTMDWMGTPISGVPPVRYWQNASSTNWTTNSNWAPTCGSVPDCVTNGIGAVITGAGIQPVITANTNVKDLTINLGATLTVNSGVTLSVCGNFTNNGTIVFQPNSTIQFIGTANQSISGTYSAVNTFQHFTVAKTGGTLTLNSDIYIAGNDSIKQGTLNNNNRSTFLRGNFYNYNGSVSFTGVGSGAGGSTLHFTGGAPQTFTNIGAPLSLNNVIMNQSVASTLTLSVGALNDMVLGTGGVLTLTQGKIITGAQRVDIVNNLQTACNAGNATSYVEGNLRRMIPGGFAAPRTYEFPVGEATKGYQRFSVQYTYAPSTQYTITASFSPWAVMPAAGPAVIECITADWSLSPPYNNGYWTLNASATAVNDTFIVNAYPLNVSNDIGMPPNGYSIMKSTPSNGGLGPWNMDGVCITPGTGVNPVSRQGLYDFSDFAVVQFNSPLPIELIEFKAEQQINGTVLCHWITASEINNNHFEIESSSNGESFTKIGVVAGFGPGISSHELNYQFNDGKICNTLNYYRLKQVDIDGRYSYSDVVAVNCKEAKDFLFAYPNPASQRISLSFFEVAEGSVTVELLGKLGNTVRSENFPVRKDQNNIELSIQDLPAGYYVIKLRHTSDMLNLPRQSSFVKQ